MNDRLKLYIDGQWVDSSGTGVIDVIDATKESVLGRIPEGTATDVDRAVAAARRAFQNWSTTSRDHRADLLDRLRVNLESRQLEIAETITAEVGTPRRIAERIQAALPLTDIAFYVDLIREPQNEERVGNSVIVRDPVGVVGCVTPWNYPLHQVTCKLAPALAAGCTVVLKPSEIAPLTAFLLMDAVHEAGFPRGVINLVTGFGDTVGEALAAHPDVDAISFTGSVETGARVAATAAASIKRVTLELGGKSANVILDDADLETAIKVGVANAFLNGGQTCTAWTRLLVPAERNEEALELARSFAETYQPGDPSNPQTKLGPLASEQQRTRVRQYIATGLAEGARLVTGGVEVPEGCATGYFVAPTVFGDVDPDSTLAQEEIFGPVLAVIPYNDEDDALAIANNSSYGLHGAVWSADEQRAVSFARRVRTGQIDVNGAPYNPAAPFGGVKKSGIGRELGREGLVEFQEIKSIQLPIR